MRQRTLPEQRELLRGLGQARAAAEPPRGRRAHGAGEPRPGPAAPAAGTKTGTRRAEDARRARRAAP